MINRIIFSAAFLFLTLMVNAQDIWFTRTGKISFHAGTSVEDVDGTNTEVASVLNTKTGELAFTALVKGFHFSRTLMEEHFNENYMESSKQGYEKSTFSGKITDLSKVNFAKDGTYTVTVSGDLTIHAVKKPVTAPATFTVKSGKISGSSTFKVLLSDYSIAIPGLVADKISKEATIEVKCDYEMKK